jgi:1-acyl-sn-glycerol-3-phosphate acyltransferase
VRPAKLIILVLLFSGFLATAFIISLGISLFRLPRLRIVSQLMRRFNRILRIFLNVKIDLEGAKDCLSADGRFIVSNHLGYLDGIVLGSLFPVIFVTKRQVKRWPVIGQLLALLGTIFVDRENKQDILRVIDRISGTLRQGANVVIFPEGTSSNGEKLLPFQSAFFAAPLMARASVAPVTITYRFVDREPLSAANRDRVYWYGDMSFVPHLWDLLGTNRLEVSVKIHPSMETSLLQKSSCGRKQLSQACYDAIAQGVNTKTEESLEVPQLFPGELHSQPF